jgi:two-component system NtrC family sensor kinase
MWPGRPAGFLTDMTAVSEDVTADLKRRMADLEERLATALTERDAAIDRQTANALVNFRLQSELRAAVERQHASAEILRAIAASSGDAERSLTQIAETTMRLFGAPSVTIRIAEGDEWIKTIRVGASSQRSGAQPGSQSAAPGANLPATVYQENRQIHIPDLDNLDPSMADWPLAATRAAGARTVSGTPLRHEGKAIGALIVYRDRPAPFTEEELALQQSFADQAVIAIENARLFNEVQAKTADLEEALQQQTAVGDVLKTISRSTFDLQPVLDTLVESAARLCNTEMAFILRRDGDVYRAGAAVGFATEFIEFLKGHPIMPDHGTVTGRAALARRAVQIRDVATEPGYTMRESTTLGNQHTALGVPLLRKNEPIGVIVLARERVELFTQNQIDLVTTFADQAVIAIENARLFNETQEALERQTANSDILRVINNAGGNLAPVFESILEKAHHLCGAPCGSLQLYDSGRVVPVAIRGMTEAFADYLRAGYPITEGVRGVLFADRPIQLLDLAEFLRSRPDEPSLRAGVELGGIGTMLTVPLAKDGTVFGRIVAGRREVRAFTDKQIDLLQGFADQAVIAIENARLFNETQEALERQTATADILKVIASSPSDVQPVFAAIATRAKTLLSGFSSTVYRFIEGQVHLEAFTPTTPEADEILTSTFPLPVSRFAPFEIVQAGEVAQIPDTENLTGEILDIARARGFRSMLFAPLMNQGAAIGLIAVTRASAGTFAGHHVQILRTFADQAVIAIENARLFNEVQARTNDLSESLQQQTATAEVLKVISRSAFDLQAVLDTLVESAAELCEADMAAITRRIGDVYYRAGSYGFPQAFAEYIKDIPVTPERRTITGRTLLEGRIVHVEDVLADPDYDFGGQELSGNPRSFLGVPLLREGTPIGALTLTRYEIRPFTQKQIELIATFADQAVIAIENVRLFDEVQERTRELSESLHFQTAASDVLKVISRSPDTLQPVLDVIAETSRELCGSDGATIFLLKERKFHLTAWCGELPSHLEFMRANPVAIGQPGSILNRVLGEKRSLHIPNVMDDPELREGSAGVGGPRALLAAPLMHDGEVVGVIILRQSHLKPFTPRQLQAIETFADQAVIAISNVNLFEEVQARTRELAKSLDDLRTAQDRLIQTEKLASLGQLTAGIAHEIKNPLNFVNNFAALSAELTDELKDALKPAALDETIRTEVDELTGLLKDNLGKVVQHGKRADSIVKNMLLHSREGSGDHRPADVNALVEESLNLAYHGARAEKPHFNVTLKRDFDPDAGMIEAFPQEITRVLLNLISNGFYAVAKRKAENGDAAFEPVISATTKGQSDHVEIHIRDNGTGIPPEVKEKMFNPFFTTKPAGEGTGLGLSMSHDIIVKQHGGRIDVDTMPGAFTEFTIVLPRTSQFSDKARGQT